MSLHGRVGRFRALTPADPAVNTIGEITVPAGVRWTPIYGSYSITTVAVTGAAKPEVDFNDAGNANLWDISAFSAIGAGVQKTITFGLYGTFATWTAQPTDFYPIPRVNLYPGGTIQLGYFGETGDIQIGGIFLTVEETILGY